MLNLHGCSGNKDKLKIRLLDNQSPKSLPEFPEGFLLLKDNVNSVRFWDLVKRVISDIVEKGLVNSIAANSGHFQFMHISFHHTIYC
jgi:hypothetical protein